MPSRATVRDGTYPRPQLIRDTWTDLGGVWQFGYDDDGVGLAARWQAGTDLADRTIFTRDITVPYPPEAPLSGIGDTTPHPVMWYRRLLRLAEVPGLDAVRDLGHRLVLRLGAVDYRARVWLDGALLGEHEGGHTPWSVDLTDAVDLDPRAGVDHVLVVRAEDRPGDVSQPRGKQEWRDDPHEVWYHRTSGIWQPVWLEVVPRTGFERVTWTPDVSSGTVRLAVELRAAPVEPVTLGVRLDLAGQVLAEHQVQVAADRATTIITVPAAANGIEEGHLLWSPEQPRLIDAGLTLVGADGTVLDSVSSYLGLRDVGVRRGAFVLNRLPYPVHAVLSQGYWPQSHLAAPDAGALRREVELIKQLGFNAVRVHQKVEDPRFLHWCDRLGVLVWAEAPSAFEFSAQAVRRTTTEWMDVVARDAGHPCVVTWVPMNESWGVDHIAVNPAEQAYVTALAELTRALDPTRPVVSNDGWEHTVSDLVTIHDYADTGAVLTQRYGTSAAVEAVLAGKGPQGRAISLRETTADGRPVLLTEFGGVRFPAGAVVDQATWGYSTATGEDDFAARLTDLFAAVHASTALAGFCYTQLTDTLQEANGLLDAERRPKLAMATLRAIITGVS